ncbi:MAG: MATE family efflux transporter [Spirochaetales bacterium]|nr:MATE family efflux transporter [Spirochaetales bacterium]
MSKAVSNNGNLTDGPIVPALVQMALPASIGYFFNTMYNAVDTYWAGALSTDSLAGLSLSFPAFGVLLSIAIGVSSGSGALVSNYLGAKNETMARRILAQALVFATLLSSILAVPLFIFLEPILGILGGGPGAQAEGLAYVQIVLLGSPFFVLNSVWNSGLQARGDTKTYRNILIVSFFMNLALDPLFMFTFGMGVRGVALATVLVQAGGIWYIARRGRTLGILKDLTFQDFKPNWALYKEIAEQSLPGILNFFTMAIGSFVITSYIGAFGTSAIAGYGASIRVEQIALIPTIGLNIALATMVGQSNGAGKIERIGQAYKVTLLMGLAIFVGVYTPIFFFGHYLVRFFNEEARVIEVGTAYLQIQSVTFFSYIILFQANSILQGLKRPGAILWIGLFRQVAAPLLVFPFLAYTLGMEVNGVWWGLVVVNWSAAAFTWWWSWRLIHQREKQVKTLEPTVELGEVSQPTA